MATFQIHKYGTQYHYSFRATNNEIVQSSEGYTTKESCQNGIHAVKENCSADRFRKNHSAAGYTFTQQASNGETIGRSEVYTSAAARDNGIDVVLREAPTAPIDDLT